MGQHGVKYAYLNNKFYQPGNKLGAWEHPPQYWDCRKALNFFYQAKLMLDDGLVEIAISTAIAAIENASAEMIKFILNNNFEQAQQEIKRHTFLSRFDQALPKYGISLPPNLFSDLKKAYFARNSVVHGLAKIDSDEAKIHLKSVENVLLWYWQKFGGEPSDLDTDIAPLDIDTNIPF